MTVAKTSPPGTPTDLLFEKASVGLCLVAPDSTIVRANAEWLRSTGFSEGQVVGENVIDLFPATRDMALAMHARARAGHRVEVPRHVQVINGRESWWEGSIEPVPMDGGAGLLVTARDVTGEVVRSARDLTYERAPKSRAERLADDLDAMTRLHRLSTRVVRSEDLAQALEETVEAAIAITRADMGNIQLLDPASRRLEIVADRGHERRWLDFFESVPEGKGASCGAALQRGTRVIVEDVTKSPVFVGTPALEVQLRAGVRAVQSTPLVGSSGNLVGMISTHYRTPRRPDERDLRLLDVLARQTVEMIERLRAEEALRESEERYRTLFTSMIEGFALGEVISDETGTPRDVRLLEMNDAFEQQTGLRRSDVQGRPLREALSHVEQHWIDTYVGVALTGQPVRFESYNRDTDRHFSLFAFSPSPGRFAVLFTDVTDRERAQEALRTVNEQLRAVDHRKDEFLGMLSHELRNPLAPIRNSTYLLRRAEPGSEQALHAQTVIERQTEHLTRIVDDLLDVTRIARGKIELRRSHADLREVVSHAADDYRVTMRDRAVRFEVDVPAEPLWADVDPTRITQLVGNLLHNAAKFTRRGGEVCLSLLRVGEAAVEIRMRDTGAGIDPTLLPRVFDAFVQGERTLARTEGGLGLGLALVKGIAQLHGGTVEARSAGEGKGSEFMVRLPTFVARQASVARKPRPERRNRVRRVLVVDDNHDAAESLAEIVKMLGHSVEVAYDGHGAIEKARAIAPDVVLCDVGLPGVSGYEVAKALREAGTAAQLFAVSGYAQPEDVKRAVEAGFDGHLAKPCDLEQIARLLG